MWYLNTKKKVEVEYLVVTSRWRTANHWLVIFVLVSLVVFSIIQASHYASQSKPQKYHLAIDWLTILEAKKCFLWNLNSRHVAALQNDWPPKCMGQTKRSDKSFFLLVSKWYTHFCTKKLGIRHISQRKKTHADHPSIPWVSQLHPPLEHPVHLHLSSSPGEKTKASRRQS